MTVAVNDRVSGPYSGDGTSTSFAYDFKIDSDAEIDVYLIEDGVDTQQTFTTHYTVTGVGNSAGGNIVFVTAPTASQKVFIEGDTPQTQEAAYTSNGAFPASSHEAALDNLQRQIQEITSADSRSIKVSRSEAAATLPATPTEDKLLARDSTGAIIYKDTTTISDSVVLGSGWSSILEDPAPSSLDDLEGVRSQDTYTAMTAMPSSEFGAGSVIYVRGRLAAGDGGHGIFEARSGTSTDDGGITLNHDTLSFHFKRKYNTPISSQWFATATETRAAAVALGYAVIDWGGLIETIDNVSSPLDYAGTSAASQVLQYKDTDALGANLQRPAVVFDMEFTGDGDVNEPISYSSSIWQGVFSTVKKSGDASAHCYTFTGELQAVGASGYNELGGIQGELTNTASTHGNISGAEILIKDSPDNGTTTFDTALKAMIGRVAHYHNSATRISSCFMGSSEGDEPVGSIVTHNDGAYDQFEYGFKLNDATFTTGGWGVFPNNTFLYQNTAAGSAVPVIGVSADDRAVIMPPTSAGYVTITNISGAERLRVDGNSNDAVHIWVGGALKRIGAGAADSAGSGYRQLIISN